MKLYLVLLVSILMFTYCGNKKQDDKIPENINGKRVMVDSLNLVGEYLCSPQDLMKELKINIDFEGIDSFKISIEDCMCWVYLEKIKDWGDPGDFHKIRFNISGKEYSYFNKLGWVRYENDYIMQNEDDDFVDSDLINSKYCIVQSVQNNGCLIFLFGYPYASEPGLLSIIKVQEEGKPYLIFNDNYFFSSFEVENGSLIVSRFYKDEILSNKGSLETFILRKTGFRKLILE